MWYQSGYIRGNVTHTARACTPMGLNIKRSCCMSSDYKSALKWHNLAVRSGHMFIIYGFFSHHWTWQCNWMEGKQVSVSSLRKRPASQSFNPSTDRKRYRKISIHKNAWRKHDTAAILIETHISFCVFVCLIYFSRKRPHDSRFLKCEFLKWHPSDMGMKTTLRDEKKKTPSLYPPRAFKVHYNELTSSPWTNFIVSSPLQVLSLRLG